ncbi:MAG: hypothetical protein RBS80_32150, partial [Thermoguttaceae bacterium]|nr:hypothetical protein [Thermoguttaceae bacterium]
WVGASNGDSFINAKWTRWNPTLEWGQVLVGNFVGETVPNAAPEVTALTADPNPVTRPGDLTLTAVDASDADGAVNLVRFYRDTNLDGVLSAGDELLGTDSDGGDGWNLTIATAGWILGEQTLFARAQDNGGALSNVVATTVMVESDDAGNLAPVVAALTAAPNPVTRPGDLTLTALGVTDLDGTVVQVEFYRDTNGNGVLDLGDELLVPLVIRDNPATAGPDSNYLQYTGDEHVVLGGTDGDDILIGSIGDDTLWGGAGNDRLEGGFGNDMIEGGPGDDIITDIGGDDVLKGGEGNDVIHAGQGLDLVIAGAGKDFIVTGEDETHTFAGPGDDFILGNRIDVFPTGNAGNDWIELGTQDGAAGDDFDPLELDLVAGHDVFLGDGGFDENLGEGGDDIVVGSEGPDKNKLGSGFDWVTYKDDPFGVMVDYYRNAFDDAPLPASLAAIGARFAQVEGLSGSAYADILRGDDADAAQIAAAGAQGSILTNLDLIVGLREFLGTAAAGPDGFVGTPDDQFGSGNIILGGSGSDILEGRGGDDLIDGDLWLNVRISVRENVDGTGDEIASYDSMIPLVPLMLNGTYNPGQLVIVREILQGSAGFDTAVFSDVREDYLVTTVDGVTTVSHLVAPGGGGGLANLSDGNDRLTNIERLQFADQTIILVPDLNIEPVGQVAILDATNTPETTPVTGQVLRASIAGVTDGDNPDFGAITGPVTYVWQYEPVPGSGRFFDISTGLAPRGAPSEIGPNLTVTPNLAGFSLRVKAHYKDANGVLETVFSAATDPVEVGPPAPAQPPLLTGEQPGVVSTGLHFLGSDLQFILDQIVIAERHAAGEDILDLIPNARMALGLRTVDGSYNNLLPNQTEFGAADNVFPRLLEPVFRDAEDGTSYAQTTGLVFDSQV